MTTPGSPKGAGGIWPPRATPLPRGGGAGAPRHLPPSPEGAAGGGMAAEDIPLCGSLVGTSCQRQEPRGHSAEQEPLPGILP